jgi:hypothetical protein
MSIRHSAFRVRKPLGIDHRNPFFVVLCAMGPLPAPFPAFVDSSMNLRLPKKMASE